MSSRTAGPSNRFLRKQSELSSVHEVVKSIVFAGR